MKRSEYLISLLEKRDQNGNSFHIYSTYLKNTIKKILQDPQFAFELAGTYQLFKNGYPVFFRYPKSIYKLAFVLTDMENKYSLSTKKALYNLVKDIVNNKKEVIEFVLKNSTVPFLREIAQMVFKEKEL